MREQIKNIFATSIEVKRQTVSRCLDDIISLTEIVMQTLKSGGKILLFGNGGSAADAQHIAAEFVNRLKKDRFPLPALALTTDTSTFGLTVLPVCPTCLAYSA